MTKGKIKDEIYHWLIMNLPHQIMYKHVHVDSQHKMWLPRFGWSKKQISDAMERAEKLDNGINWE